MSSFLRLIRLSRFRNAYLFRGFAVWGGLRLFLAFLELPHPGTLERIVTVSLAGIAVFLDARRRDEDVFLGNLGISGVAIAFMAIPVPVALEWFVL
jgi:hypothetical protein